MAKGKLNQRCVPRRGGGERDKSCSQKTREKKLFQILQGEFGGWRERERTREGKKVVAASKLILT